MKQDDFKIITNDVRCKILNIYCVILILIKYITEYKKEVLVNTFNACSRKTIFSNEIKKIIQYK